jgi:hypothetical protein
MVNVRLHKGTKFRLSVSDYDPTKSNVKHRSVVARIAGHDDSFGINIPSAGQEGNRSTFVCIGWQDVQVTI